MVLSNVEPLHKVDAKLPGLAVFAAIARENNIIWPLAPGEISISTGFFRDLLRFALERVQFDSNYYLRSYPDISEALEKGLFKSPHHHYVEFGYFENRLPFRIEVDEEFYFRSNPDIKASVSAGTIPSAQAHFERHGFKEGRLPREDWSLLAK